MAFHRFHLLLVLSLLFSLAKAENTGSVFFIDGSAHQFIRKSSPEDIVKSESMLDTEVGAAVSVLLGFAPPSTLSQASSSKLNDVLVPNPFQRPRAVFMLEVRGVDDSNLMVQNNAILSGAHSSKIVYGSNMAKIQLPDEDEVAVVSLDETTSDFTDKNIGAFASWMGGSYVSDTVEPLNGELTIPLPKGANVKLHMSKKADREFVQSLLSLINNCRRAIEMHEDFSHGKRNPAELLTGSFNGLKALQEEYGLEGLTRQGEELLLFTLTKMSDFLQEAYQGQIVGVICFYGASSQDSGKVLDVAFVPRPSVRVLEERVIPFEMQPRVILVRLTLAWITGIILIISTLLGIYFLLNMSVTRDTLLYSNVKLD
ncbi:hypothetical protein UlMin_010273 [Ulmus minor]